jgi:hypothetical protein
MHATGHIDGRVLWANLFLLLRAALRNNQRAVPGNFAHPTGIAKCYPASGPLALLR